MEFTEEHKVQQSRQRKMVRLPITLNFFRKENNYGTD
jgi:hypothetical protein